MRPFIFDERLHGDWSGSRHADHDVDVPPCGLGIRTPLVRRVYKALVVTNPVKTAR